MVDGRLRFRAHGNALGMMPAMRRILGDRLDITVKKIVRHTLAHRLALIDVLPKLMRGMNIGRPWNGHDRIWKDWTRKASTTWPICSTS